MDKCTFTAASRSVSLSTWHIRPTLCGITTSAMVRWMPSTPKSIRVSVLMASCCLSKSLTWGWDVESALCFRSFRFNRGQPRPGSLLAGKSPELERHNGGGCKDCFTYVLAMPETKACLQIADASQRRSMFHFQCCELLGIPTT